LRHVDSNQVLPHVRGCFAERWSNMIYYDCHSRAAFFQLRGSVIPRAFLIAIFFSMLGAALNLMEEQGIMSVRSLQSELNTSLFTSFTFTLGFMLVFRSNQCYTRFWRGAKCLGNLRAEMQQAASGLVAFTRMSTHCPQELDCFIHKLVRLSSLLHANVLQAISDVEDMKFPVLDLAGLDPEKNTLS